MDDLYHDDTKLRENGYAIHSRPESGPVLWIKDKKVVTQQEALDAISAKST